MLLAVLDPGVLIAALISSRGVPRELISRWLDGYFELVASERLLDEIWRVLLRPKFRRYVTEQEAVEYVRLLRSFASLVPDPLEVPRAAPDPGDDYLFALAESAGVRWLVSGDRALTGLPHATVQVVTPRVFSNILMHSTDLEQP